MNCEEFLLELEEYCDGEANALAGEQMRAHLSACLACAHAYDELLREQEIYQRYQQEIDLPPTLWASMQARLAAERAANNRQRPQRFNDWLATAFAVPRLSLALTAALLLLAVGATAIVMRYAQTRLAYTPRAEQARTSPQSDAGTLPTRLESVTPTAPESAGITGPPIEAGETATSESSALSAAERNNLARASNRSRLATARVRSENEPSRAASPAELVREAARTYEAAIAILQRDAEQRRAQLDPETRARFDRALVAIDRTIADTRRAVRDNPGDPLAARYMQAAYVRKIEVLREITDY